MSRLDPLTWSGFAQGLLVGVLAVLAIQTAWRHRPGRLPPLDSPWTAWQIVGAGQEADLGTDAPPGSNNVWVLPSRGARDGDVVYDWDRDGGA